MKRWLPVLTAATTLAVAAGCSLAGIDLDQVIAIEVTVPDSGRVEEADSLQLRAAALNAGGDSVPGAVIVWERIDTGKITLDTASGLVVGVTPTVTTPVRVRARYQNLPSNAISITVLAAADTIQPEGPVLDTLTAPDSLSAPLQAKLLDLTTTPGTPVALNGRPVSFALTLFPANDGARLVTAVADSGVAQLVVKTAGSGVAAVQLKLRAGQTAPDSAVVTAVAIRGNGSTVPGSPITFTVVVQP